MFKKIILTEDELVIPKKFKKINKYYCPIKLLVTFFFFIAIECPLNPSQTLKTMEKCTEEVASLELRLPALISETQKFVTEAIKRRVLR